MKCSKEKFNSIALIISSISLAFSLLMFTSILDRNSNVSSEIVFFSLVICALSIAASLLIFINSIRKNITKNILAISAFLTFSSCGLISLTNAVEANKMTFSYALQLAMIIGLIVVYALSLTNAKLNIAVLILTIIEAIIMVPYILAASTMHLALFALLLLVIISLLKKEENLNE